MFSAVFHFHAPRKLLGLDKEKVWGEILDRSNKNYNWDYFIEFKLIIEKCKVIFFQVVTWISVFCEWVAASQYVQAGPCFAELLLAHGFDHSPDGQKNYNGGVWSSLSDAAAPFGFWATWWPLLAEWGLEVS